MRAIIIDDKDARSLLQELELRRLQERNFGLNQECKDLSPDEVLAKVHKVFHYVVCKWLQEQGAKVT